MDYHKELAVLTFVNILWKKDISSLSKLKDGKFFVFVIKLIDPTNSASRESDSYRCRLLFVKKFLQDFYGESTDIDKFIKFDALSSAIDEIVKLELAKISIVLLGIGLLGENKDTFMSSALGVPQHLQEDVLAIIQSVIIPHSTEVMLTDEIDRVLRQPTETIKQSPVCDLMKMDEYVNSDDKQYLMSPLVRNITPDRRVHLQDETPLKDLSSPFRALEIKSPSSSLINFTRSPQFIQKAVMKQKDLEMRKLRETLNSEIIQKEEAEAALQDKLLEIENKDSELHRLRERIHQLQETSWTSSDGQDLKSANSEINLLKQQVSSLTKYKEKCEILEVENRFRCEEISSLHLKIKSLEADVSKNKKLQNAVHQMASQVQELQDKLAEMSELKIQWEDERESLCSNLEGLRVKNRELEQQLEDMEGRGYEDKLESSGESMGVVADIQIGELKIQMEEMKTDKEHLIQQLEARNKEMQTLQNHNSSYEKSLTKLRETNSNLNSALAIERDTNQKMKSHMDSQVTKCKEVTLKFEALQKVNEVSAQEIKRLTTALSDTNLQLQTLQEKQKEESNKMSCNHPLAELTHQDAEALLGESCTRKYSFVGSKSIRMKPSLSPGYDSLDEPDLKEGLSSVSLFKDSLTSSKKSETTCVSLRTRSETRSGGKKDLTLQRGCKGSTVTTQSIKSMKELLPGVFPTAMACANEPEDHSFEWDKLSQIKDSVDSKPSGDQTVNPFRDDGRISKRKIPLRPSVIENYEMAVPIKQMKTSGTVLYFPLDPNGPIYPPPKPTVNFKGKSGRLNRAAIDKAVSSPEAAIQGNCSRESFASNWKTNP